MRLKYANFECLPHVSGALHHLINFAGWGRTVGGGNAADTLQQAMLPVAEHSACSRINGKLVSVDERSMVCAGGQGKGGCQVRKTSFLTL